jgi:hypothetical protein
VTNRFGHQLSLMMGRIVPTAVIRGREAFGRTAAKADFQGLNTGL